MRNEAVSPLIDFLDDERRILLAIRSRLELCVAFEKELTAISRGKRFSIRNERFWDMVLDHRADVLAITPGSLMPGFPVSYTGP